MQSPKWTAALSLAAVLVATPSAAVASAPVVDDVAILILDYLIPSGWTFDHV